MDGSRFFTSGDFQHREIFLQFLAAVSERIFSEMAFFSLKVNLLASCLQ